MKKRREQVSESGSPTEKKPNIFQNQFFQDLFQDMKEINVESEDPYLEEFDNSLVEEIPEEEIPEANLFEEEYKKIKLIKKHDLKKQLQVSFFKNSEDLKQGFIIKEILDKPRALRKNIM